MAYQEAFRGHSYVGLGTLRYSIRASTMGTLKVEFKDCAVNMAHLSITHLYVKRSNCYT